jgi:hypothetical protein
MRTQLYLTTIQSVARSMQILQLEIHVSINANAPIVSGEDRLKKTPKQFVPIIAVGILSSRRLRLRLGRLQGSVNVLLSRHLRQWCQPAVCLVEATDRLDESYK